MENHKIFFEKLDKFGDELKSSIAQEKKGKVLTHDFLEIISQNIKAGEVSQSNPLSGHIETTNILLGNLIKQTNNEWQNFELAEELSKNFGDKLVFFIFGKVNAGKSSFSNLFLELSEKKSNINISYLDSDGKVKSNNTDEFKVGQTETTATIQWVEIDNLILVDSPGLHSMTIENGELTKKYLNSADAIVWLTSSGSPGQTQELEALSKELKKEKPILPIITKSDFYEEDWCEETDEIISILKPKTQETRELQEDDVQKRAKEALEGIGISNIILQPISISSQCAKENMMEASNIETLFGILNSKILDKSIEYKSQKPKNILKKYFEIEIIENIDKNLLPEIDTLKNALLKQKEDLKIKESILLNTIINNTNLRISTLVAKYENNKNINKLVEELSTYIDKILSNEIEKILKDFFDNIKDIAININANEIEAYEDIEITYREKGAKRSLFTKAITFDWSDREDSSTHREKIGVDSSKVIESLQNTLKLEITDSIQGIFTGFDKSINNIIENIDKMNTEIAEFKNKIKELNNEK